VAAFLRAHPEFLAERPELYRTLDPPRRVHGDRMADHMAAMLSAERRRVRGLEAEMDAALNAERAGHGLTIRVRLAVLALMRCGDVPEAVTQEMPALLGIETCTLLSEAPDRRGVVRLARGAAARLLPPGRDAAVRPAPTDAELIHQEAGAAGEARRPGARAGLDRPPDPARAGRPRPERAAGEAEHRDAGVPRPGGGGGAGAVAGTPPVLNARGSTARPTNVSRKASCGLGVLTVEWPRPALEAASHRGRRAAMQGRR
jgi:hypothetical protein